jgi:hypothetical protein
MRVSLWLARIFFFLASKKLVTGPNGIMVAYCPPSDGLASFLKTTLADGIKVVKKVITSKFRFHLIAIYALGCFRNFSWTPQSEE